MLFQKFIFVFSNFFTKENYSKATEKTLQTLLDPDIRARAAPKDLFHVYSLANVLQSDGKFRKSFLDILSVQKPLIS